MTPELLERIARGYGFASMRVIESLTSGGVERSWHVEGERQRQYFLKAFDGQHADRARLEASILGHLNAQASPAYRVQRLVRTPPGEPLFASDGGTFMLTEWQNGRAKEWREFSSDDWQVLGATLGALHTRLRALRLPHLHVTSLSSRLASVDLASERVRIESQRRLASLNIAYPLCREADRYFEQRLMLLDRFLPLSGTSPTVNEQLIHNDYTESNFIFDPAGGITILDWERAISAPPEYDVVRGLVIVPVVAPAYAARFVAGYRQFSSIDPRVISDIVRIYMIEQALKHWPTESWLRGEEWGRIQFESNFEIMDLLAGQADLLLNFYADKC